MTETCATCLHLHPYTYHQDPPGHQRHRCSLTEVRKTLQHRACLLYERDYSNTTEESDERPRHSTR